MKRRDLFALGSGALAMFAAPRVFSAPSPGDWVGLPYCKMMGFEGRRVYQFTLTKNQLATFSFHTGPHRHPTDPYEVRRVVIPTCDKKKLGGEDGVWDNMRACIKQSEEIHDMNSVIMDHTGTYQMSIWHARPAEKKTLIHILIRQGNDRFGCGSTPILEGETFLGLFINLP